MDFKRLQKLQAELGAFLDELMPDRLGNLRRRRWAEVYVRGLLLDGARKSIEPMAGRLRAIDRHAEDAIDYEQSLQQLINQSPWDDRCLRDRLARKVVAAAGVGGALLIDDTGFPKQGAHSVGVARQYSGTLGKVGNCQVAVTLQYATERAVFCVDAALYLRDRNPIRYDYLASLQSVHYEDCIEVNYQLDSTITQGSLIELRVRADEAEGKGAVPSL